MGGDYPLPQTEMQNLERDSHTLVFIYSELGRTMQLGLVIAAAIVEIGLGAETRNGGWAPVFGNA